MKKLHALVATAAAVAIALTGCASGGADPQGEDTGGTVDLAAYQAIVDKYTADVKWAGTDIPAPAPDGLNVGILVCTVELEGCRLPMEGIQEAVDKLGWTQKTSVTTDPGQYSAAFKSLLLENPDIVFMIGITQSIVADGIAQAKADGIPIVSVLGGNQPGGDNAVDAEVQPDAELMGEAIAAKMIVDFDGKPNAIVLHDGEFDYEVTAGPTLKACATCTVAQTIDFAVSELQTTFAPKVVTALQADPEINSIYLPFDPPAALLVPALITSGYQDMPVYTQLGTSGGLNFVRQGQSIVADIAPPEKWAGWAAVDAGIRLFTGLEVQPANLPAKILTIDNLPPEGEPFDGDDVDYRGNYLGLWGK